MQHGRTTRRPVASDRIAPESMLQPLSLLRAVNLSSASKKDGNDAFSLIS
jgi:hypothetical protein